MNGNKPALKTPSRARRLLVTTLILNAVLFLGLAVVYWASDSQLVLAQAADSLQDVVVSIVLVVTASVGLRPSDDNHPFGHQRAEPIGALVAAVLAGVLAFEVAQSGVMSLIERREPTLSVSVLVMLGAKFVLKSAWMILLGVQGRGQQSATLRAAQLDTRNDVAATASSLVGFAMARMGFVWADAAFSLPVACYVGYNGVSLARENLRYLMGESPTAEVYQQLRDRVLEVERVLEIRRLRAHYVGQELHVATTVLVESGADATQVHDTEVTVQRALESHELVAEAYVHCDPATG